MAWEDNFNPLITETLPLEGGKKEWRFTLEEHKTKGTMNLNVRIWQVEGSYTGPTKSGFVLGIKSKEEVEELQKAFNDYFEKVKEMF
jgi:hypothetical protein